MRQKLQGDWDANNFSTYGATTIVMPAQFYDLLSSELDTDNWHVVDEANNVKYPQWYLTYQKQKRMYYGEKAVPSALRLAGLFAAQHLEQWIGRTHVVDISCWYGTGDMPWHTDDRIPTGEHVNFQLLSYIGDSHNETTGGDVLFKSPSGAEAYHCPHNRSSVVHKMEPGFVHRTVAHREPLSRTLVGFALASI